MRVQERVVNIPVAVVAKTTTTGKLTSSWCGDADAGGPRPRRRGSDHESDDSFGVLPDARKDSRMSALRAS